MAKRRKPVVKKKKSVKKRVGRRRTAKPSVEPPAIIEPGIESGDDGGEGLSPKRRAFVYEFLRDRNATQAAIRAGYSAHTADQQGSRLLTNVKVRELIEDGERRAAVRANVSVDYVLDNAVEVLERCLQRAPVMVRRGKYIVQLTDEDENDVWRFDAKGASSALALLAKHTGGFSERHEHTGKDGGPIEVADADKIRERISSRISGIASRMGTNGVSAKPHARRAGAA